MSTLKFILRNLDQYRRKFWVVVMVHGLNAAVMFMIPVMLAEFTTHPFDARHLTALLLSITGLYIAGLGLQWVGRYHGESLAFQFGNHIRSKYFRAVERLHVVRLQKYHSGYVLSLINKIGDSLDMVVYEFPALFVGGAVTIILFFGFTARQSLVLAFVNVGILLVFVSLGTVLARRMVPLAAEQNKRRASLLGSYADFMANIITIKKLGINQFTEGVIDRKTVHMAEQIDTVQRFHAKRWLLLHALYGAAFLGTIAFLLKGVAHGTVNASILILFISAYATIQGLIERLAENIKSYMELHAYITNLEEVIGDDEASPSKSAIRDWKRLQFQGVRFCYEPGMHMIIIDSFVIRRGEHICIVGKSGQGKSTFLNLLTDQLQPTQGQRLIDDMPYEDAAGSAFFTANTAVISQEVDLFNMSLRENIVLGQKTNDATIIKLLQEVDLGDWFDGLEYGLDTMLGEKGATLSAGQKQRVNIVRGIVLDRQLYIIDEPTSHLDDLTEQKIVSFLAKHLRGKTALIVTHRPALQDLSTRTYEMKNHRLDEV